MKLYEINQQIDELINNYVDQESGEIQPGIEEFLNQFEMERKEKIHNIILYIKNLFAHSSAIKSEVDKLNKVRKTTEVKAESLTNYLLSQVKKGEKHSFPNAIVSWRKSESVESHEELFPKIHNSHPGLFKIICEFNGNHGSHPEVMNVLNIVQNISSEFSNSVLIAFQLDKKKAKELIKSGESLEGISIKTNQNIQIK